MLRCALQRMNASRLPPRSSALLLALALAACGGGGGSGTPPPPGLAAISTLAYVVSDCRGSQQGGTIRQSLQIRQADRTAITVAEADVMSPLSLGGVARCLVS